MEPKENKILDSLKESKDDWKVAGLNPTKC